jgi:DNA-binding NtrC family response regulator
VDLGKIGAVLVIDDSEEVYKNVQAVIGTRAKVHWATTLDDAFELLERMPVSVVVSDVQLGGVDITLALKSLKRVAPSVVTVVLAWFRDTKQLVDLINQAQVFRFLPKPIRPHMLETTIDSAMRRHCELRDSPILSRQHQVDQAAAPEATPVSSRIMAFFQRWGARK